VTGFRSDLEPIGGVPLAATARGRRAIGIGEILWDLLPAGPRLGGAPFNVVAHLRRLGFHAAYLSAVGRDKLGARASAEVTRLGVDASLIQLADLPTGIVRVELGAGGVPAYEIVSPAAYEATRSPDLPPAGSGFDVIVFGTLAQRFPGIAAATTRLSGQCPDAVRLYDVNLRPGCWTPALVARLLELATVVKMNEAEAATIAGTLMIPVAPLQDFARALAERDGARGVCVTRGADGAALLLDGVFRQVRAVPVEVADTVGAGDAFAAGLAAGVAAGWPIEAILDWSSRLAGLVASRVGAIPDWEMSELGRLPGAAVTG
jgi:fructokinase